MIRKPSSSTGLALDLVPSSFLLLLVKHLLLLAWHLLLVASLLLLVRHLLLLVRHLHLSHRPLSGLLSRLRLDPADHRVRLLGRRRRRGRGTAEAAQAVGRTGHCTRRGRPGSAEQSKWPPTY